MHSMNGSWYDDGKSGVVAPIFPYPAFELIQSKGTMFSSIFAFRRAERLTLAINGQSDVARGEYVSGDYFRGLGVPPAAGRLIIRNDDRAGAPMRSTCTGKTADERVRSVEVTEDTLTVAYGLFHCLLSSAAASSLTGTAPCAHHW